MEETYYRENLKKQYQQFNEDPGAIFNLQFITDTTRNNKENLFLWIDVVLESPPNPYSIPKLLLADLTCFEFKEICLKLLAKNDEVSREFLLQILQQPPLPVIEFLYSTNIPFMALKSGITYNPSKAIEYIKLGCQLEINLVEILTDDQIIETLELFCNSNINDKKVIKLFITKMYARFNSPKTTRAIFEIVNEYTQSYVKQFDKVPGWFMNILRLYKKGDRDSDYILMFLPRVKEFIPILLRSLNSLKGMKILEKLDLICNIFHDHIEPFLYDQIRPILGPDNMTTVALYSAFRSNSKTIKEKIESGDLGNLILKDVSQFLLFISKHPSKFTQHQFEEIYHELYKTKKIGTFNDFVTNNIDKMENLVSEFLYVHCKCLLPEYNTTMLNCIVKVLTQWVKGDELLKYGQYIKPTLKDFYSITILVNEEGTLPLINLYKLLSSSSPNEKEFGDLLDSTWFGIKIYGRIASVTKLVTEFPKEYKLHKKEIIEFAEKKIEGGLKEGFMGLLLALGEDAMQSSSIRSLVTTTLNKMVGASSLLFDDLRANVNLMKLAALAFKSDERVYDYITYIFALCSITMENLGDLDHCITISKALKECLECLDAPIHTSLKLIISKLLGYESVLISLVEYAGELVGVIDFEDLYTVNFTDHDYFENSTSKNKILLQAAFEMDFGAEIFDYLIMDYLYSLNISYLNSMMHGDLDEIFKSYNISMASIIDRIVGYLPKTLFKPLLFKYYKELKCSDEFNKRKHDLVDTELKLEIKGFRMRELYWLLDETPDQLEKLFSLRKTITEDFILGIIIHYALNQTKTADIALVSKQFFNITSRLISKPHNCYQVDKDLSMGCSEWSVLKNGITNVLYSELPKIPSSWYPNITKLVIDQLTSFDIQFSDNLSTVCINHPSYLGLAVQVLQQTKTTLKKIKIMFSRHFETNYQREIRNLLIYLLSFLLSLRRNECSFKKLVLCVNVMIPEIVPFTKAIYSHFRDTTGKAKNGLWIDKLKIQYDYGFSYEFNSTETLQSMCPYIDRLRIHLIDQNLELFHDRNGIKRVKILNFTNFSDTNLSPIFTIKSLNALKIVTENNFIYPFLDKHSSEIIKNLEHLHTLSLQLTFNLYTTITSSPTKEYRYILHKQFIEELLSKWFLFASQIKSLKVVELHNYMNKHIPLLEDFRNVNTHQFTKLNNFTFQKLI
ncbi:hypothetical protein DLAC_03199 [Tieghemostelium lacteum]|uniref:Uncharacterized protein n=1 Tax=Tieghemostelium lacteum TaxID=361077 RepID=A0A152A1U0_TIELA|nr:hypothetical protein DLAC_03199 [Tieghemostelium lacteum]|eukprot:KYR00055.1 hypothetical protein DLAC_03199 [Tieghemostelium lacteum]